MNSGGQHLVRASHGYLFCRLLSSVKPRVKHYSQPHSCVVQQFPGKGGVFRLEVGVAFFETSL